MTVRLFPANDRFVVRPMLWIGQRGLVNLSYRPPPKRIASQRPNKVMARKRPYKELIDEAVRSLPVVINPDIKVEGRPPTQASSEFLTNKEQGDWAESLVFAAINDNSKLFRAVKYGMSDSLAAGDEGFATFYGKYQEELNTVGKRPDLLIYRRDDFKEESVSTEDVQTISNAVAAIEVRSSSFLAKRYADYMAARSKKAVEQCEVLTAALLAAEMRVLLESKSPALLNLLEQATPTTFTELDFRLRSWATTADLQKLSGLLRNLKEQIKVLQKRDYLSITPKVEDIALVNRWVQKYNVPHYYLQVFFDKAYIIPFIHILELVHEPEKEGRVYSIEEDLKNQGKTTIKINVQIGREVIGKIDLPDHRSVMKELDRGRLLFFVTFEGGRGYLDNGEFERIIMEGI